MIKSLINYPVMNLRLNKIFLNKKVKTRKISYFVVQRGDSRVNGPLFSKGKDLTLSMGVSKKGRKQEKTTSTIM